jgi:protein-tyrosine phosphatase
MRSARFEGLMKTIGQLIRTGTVLLHCGSGVSRSPVIVAVYMHLVGYKNRAASVWGIRDGVAETRSIRKSA